MPRLSEFQNRLIDRAQWLICLSVIGVACSSVAGNAGKAQSRLLESDFNDNRPIPHSVVEQSSGEGIVKAMLSCGTDRYAHAVLGDAIEAACLIVEDESGSVVQLDLPDHQVFEDLIPRIADVNSDGQNDVVLVRSGSRTGAALTVYSLTADRACRDTCYRHGQPVASAYRRCRLQQRRRARCSLCPNTTHRRYFKSLVNCGWRL